MNRDRWQAVSPHLDRALEMGTEEREAWLAALRTTDPGLAADLDELLAERSALSKEGFLESAGPRMPFSTARAGQAFGAYSLVAPIGRGGMGSVWLARRNDGRFEGFAALKLLNAELIGRASESRFEREGSILARLRHPHIAHLIDAGVSAAGQPYLVLEHVEGEHIDRYCDTHALSVEARVRLFMDVLSAVAYAHANLVVHRDLKPSNVLVSTAGEAKLLDFGIAKLLQGDDANAGEPTALTREAGRAFTPEYAAPEQVTGGTITTATDVYALGALLYLLLGGRHPAGGAVRSPADLLRAIVDTEPQRLSEGVTDARTETAPTLLENAARRASTPERLRRLLQGDLDTIVAKALKKRPEERYASVTALADDLRRYLADEPIRARPDTLAYRTAKLVRRHRVPVALGTVAVLALVGGLAGTLVQARRAQRAAAAAEAQRDFALRQLSHTEAVNDLNAFLLSDAAPGGKPFTVGDLLGKATEIAEKSQGEAPENRAALLISIGSQYQSLDDDTRARRLLNEAYEAAKQSAEPAARARAACALASALARTNEFNRAESLLAEGMRTLPSEPEFALDRVFCALRGSEVARDAEHADAAVERVLAAQRELRESHQGSALLELRVAMDVAETYRTAGRLREAKAAFEDASKRLAGMGRGDTQTAGTLLNNWALVVRGLGQPLGADPLFRRAIEIGSADGGTDAVAPVLLNNYARNLADLGRLAEAREYSERAEHKARSAGNEQVLTNTQFLRTAIYRQQGELDHAAAVLAELGDRLDKSFPAEHPTHAIWESEHGLQLQLRGEAAAARAAQDRALALAESLKIQDVLSVVLLRKSGLELAEGHFEAARAAAARAVEIERASAEEGAPSSWLGRTYLALGRALLGQGKSAEAKAAFTTAVEQLAPALGADHAETREARRLAGGEVPGSSR